MSLRPRHPVGYGLGLAMLVAGGVFANISGLPGLLLIATGGVILGASA